MRSWSNGSAAVRLADGEVAIVDGFPTGSIVQSAISERHRAVKQLAVGGFSQNVVVGLSVAEVARQITVGWDANLIALCRRWAADQSQEKEGSTCYECRDHPCRSQGRTTARATILMFTPVASSLLKLKFKRPDQPALQWACSTAPLLSRRSLGRRLTLDKGCGNLRCHSASR
jgi:hypothetical protein